MTRACVYDCVHPLWGGGGTCDFSDDGNSGCACDAGYASRDSKGNASCVPRRALVVGYLLVGTASLLAAAITVWNINQYRHLPVRIQCARKTMIRLRALMSTSVYLLGFVVIGFVLAAAAGDAGYSDIGICQMNYVVFTPSLMFGVAMGADYWVQCLPSQLLAPGSFARMLKDASEARDAFVLMGLANAALIATLGVLMVFFQDWPQMVVDLAIGVGTTCMGGVIVFVATQTNGAISQAMAKGSASSRAFYTTAKNNLRLQAVTLFGVCFAALVVTAVKQLTVAGRSTPIIAWTAQILAAHAGIVVFALATKFEASSATSSSANFPVDVDILESMGSSAVTAISSAAVCAQALLLEQRMKMSMLPAVRGGKCRALYKWMTRYSNHTSEGDVAPCDVVDHPESACVRKTAHPSCRDVDTARVVPVHEDHFTCDQGLRSAR